MAVGFIVVRLDDTGTPDAYWDGTDFVASVDSSDFIETKPEARYIQGSTQAQSTEQDIVVRDAETTVTLL
ncbi:MAG: hypothetical protein AAF349_00260 [Cyanobacteria bacterium P01_A01_bin.68]